jgi:Diacylglycerol acyltransferase
LAGGANNNKQTNKQTQKPNRDASRPAVHQALREGSRLGLLPGGIPEIFEGYPNKPLSHPEDEFAIVPRGFVKMAFQHNLPIVPVYCFGATKMFQRLSLPNILEKWSLMLRISLCYFFGRAGLPIPFRQKIFYVMGDAIQPQSPNNNILLSSRSGLSGDDAAPTFNNNNNNTQEEEDAMVLDLHQRFCEELMRLFENHKELYGWGHKTLHLVTR